MTRQPLATFLTFCAGLAFAAGAADGQPEPVDADSLVSVRVTPSIEALHGSEMFLIAVEFRMEPHWHIYWANPGETGMPTEVRVTAPKGYRVGDVMWPRPQEIEANFTTYGYENETMLFVPVTAPAELAEGEAEFEVMVDWLVCKESCYMGSAIERVTVRTRSGDRATDHAAGTPLVRNEKLRQYLKQVPTPASEATDIEVHRRAGGADDAAPHVVMLGPTHGAAREAIHFFPHHTPGVSADVTIATNDETGRFAVSLRPTVEKQNTQGVEPRVRGVLVIGEKPDAPAYEIDLPVNIE